MQIFMHDLRYFKENTCVMIEKVINPGRFPTKHEFMKKVDTICIIDDDEIYQLFTKKAIQKLDISKRTLSFYNGEEAIHYIKTLIESDEQLPDIILLDINMPFMDGWQFMDAFMKIKEKLKQKTTIYIVSSSIAPTDKSRAVSYEEIAGYISKPVETDTLLKIVQLKLEEQV
jgi:CheY-like chemotaxis protein